MAPTEPSLDPFLYIYIYILTCPHKREWGIRTNDLRFMKRDPQPIELLLRNTHILFRLVISTQQLISRYMDGIHAVGPTI
jgi:hypothetical protein